MTAAELELYHLKEKERIGKRYCSDHKPGFAKKEDFQIWFVTQLIQQQYRCYYCETTIFVIQQLINSGKLLPRKVGYGMRGPVLEVDKMQNDLGYRPDNCVLACLYCNNDKSSILNAEVYKQFFGPARHAFFQHLLAS